MQCHPKAYNFSGDDVDLVVKIKDKEKLKAFIKTNKENIQKMLDANKSYDGYMALTSSRVDDIIDDIDNKGGVDVMVISYIQEKYPLDLDDDFNNLLVYEYEGSEQNE